MLLANERYLWLLQLNSGDYRIYKDAANDAGFAVLEYDVMKAGSGILDRVLSLIGAITVTDGIEASPSPLPSALRSPTMEREKWGREGGRTGGRRERWGAPSPANSSDTHEVVP